MFLSNRNSTDSESNPQLVVKFKQNEHGELTTVTNSSNSIQTTNNNEYTNGCNGSSHDLSLTPQITQESHSPIEPHITNMLSNLNDEKQWNNHQMNINHMSPQPITAR